MNHVGKQSGFVLNTMLMLLIIFSLLAISATEISIIEIRISNHMLHREHLLQTTMLCLQQAETVLIQHEYSQALSTEVASDAQYHDQKWWQEKAENFSPYELFVIEKIANVPCSQIQGAQQSGVDFYRVTARAIKNPADEGIIMQSTFAKLAEQSLVCNNPQKIHAIKAGRQSWREVE